MSPSPDRVDIEAVRQAEQAIASRVLRTPLQRSQALSQRCGVPVFLKLESRQPTGSFKVRGATNALLALSDEQRKRGVVAASTGNHGRALAHAGQAESVRTVVCMSQLVPAHKVEAVRALGAEVRIVGHSQDDAQDEVGRLVVAEALTEIPPFDDLRVIAGQGTIGLEIAADLPDAACVLVPLSGGGLAAGIAIAVKALRPRARVVGVSMQLGAAMQASLAQGRPVPVKEVPTLADSLGGGIGLQNRHTFALCRDLLDEVILVSEDEIAAAIRHAGAVEGETVEGGGAVGIAAVLAGKAAPSGPAVIVISGRNIDPALHGHIVSARNRAS